MTVAPGELRPGDVLILSGIKATVRRVEVRKAFFDGSTLYDVIRESEGREERRRYPDGRAEATLIPADRVTVIRQVSTMETKQRKRHERAD